MVATIEPLDLDIQITSDLVTKRGHSILMKGVLKGALRFWRETYLPKHFRSGAETRPGGSYGYAKRTKKYQIQKAKRYHHQRPNVYTGELERTVRSNSRITGTQRKATFRARGSHPMPIEQRQELTTIPPDEFQQIKEWIAEHYARGTRSPKFRRRRRHTRKR